VFLWWVIGGLAGIGKSRLALEFAQTLDGNWLSCFAEVRDLPRLESDIVRERAHHLIIIDYAASHPEEVSRLLMICARARDARKKVRVLLLERDVSRDAYLWERLLPPGTHRSAALNPAFYNEPLSLESLAGHERSIVSAWMDAAGADPALLPKKSARIWLDIRRITQSRPLHLGLVAAALASGKKSIASSEDLLNGVLKREVTRWRARARAEGSFDQSVPLIALATALHGLPVPWPGDPSPVLVDPPKGQSYLMIKHGDEPERIAHVADLLQFDQFRDRTERWIREHAAELKSDLGEVIPDSAFLQKLKSAWELNGGWRLQPDQIGEFFLAQYWGPPLVRPGALAITPAPDAELQHQCRGAINVSWPRFMFTLTELRARSWGAAAFLRCAPIVSAITAVAADTGLATYWSMLLSDACIRLGGQKTNLADRRTLVPLLSQIKVAYPSDGPTAVRS
jgi:hypothetical protein